MAGRLIDMSHRPDRPKAGPLQILPPFILLGTIRRKTLSSSNSGGGLAQRDQFVRRPWVDDKTTTSRAAP
eukprot:761684-Hanusia_phi.AAC.8